MKAAIYILCVLVGTVTGVGLYSWRQATYVPTEYQLSSSSLSTDALRVEQLLTAEPKAQGDHQAITLTEAEVSQLLAQRLATQPHSAALIKAARGINTSMQNGRIEAGMVVNLSDIPTDHLPATAQQALTRLENQLPILANRDVYISVVGRPRVEAGRLVFDDDARLRVGRMQLPLADVVAQLGLSPDDLETYLVDYLDHNGIVLETINVTNGQMEIDIRP